MLFRSEVVDDDESSEESSKEAAAAGDENEDEESYSRSCPSLLELRVVLGLLPGGSFSPHGPWSACLQPSPCDLTRDSALTFLVLAGLLSGSMGLPIKYPHITSSQNNRGMI